MFEITIEFLNCCAAEKFNSESAEQNCRAAERSGLLSFGKMIEGGEGLQEYIPQFSYDLYNFHDYEDERILLAVR